MVLFTYFTTGMIPSTKCLNWVPSDPFADGIPMCHRASLTHSQSDIGWHRYQIKPEFTRKIRLNTNSFWPVTLVSQNNGPKGTILKLLFSCNQFESINYNHRTQCTYCWSFIYLLILRIDKNFIKTSLLLTQAGTIYFFTDILSVIFYLLVFKV